MQNGPLRDQKGIAKETSPTITGERNTVREMRAQQCTRVHGGIQPAAHLRKLPVPHALSASEDAAAKTPALTRNFSAWRTRDSLASQRRQADPSRRNQSQSQSQIKIQPEPTTRHGVTSVYAHIAVVSSLCRHLPSAPAGSSKIDYTPPGARRSKAKRLSFLVPERRWLSGDRSDPEQRCPSGIIPHAGQGMRMLI
jgi:hypothetical protein